MRVSSFEGLFDPFTSRDASPLFCLAVPILGMRKSCSPIANKGENFLSPQPEWAIGPFLERFGARLRNSLRNNAFHALGEHVGVQRVGRIPR